MDWRVVSCGTFGGVKSSGSCESSSGVSGCKENIDSNLLSQWVTKRIKAFRKFVGTSSEGLEEQVTGLFLALEARRK